MRDGAQRGDQMSYEYIDEAKALLAVGATWEAASRMFSKGEMVIIENAVEESDVRGMMEWAREEWKDGYGIRAEILEQLATTKAE